MSSWQIVGYIFLGLSIIWVFMTPYMLGINHEDVKEYIRELGKTEETKLRRNPNA